MGVTFPDGTDVLSKRPRRHGHGENVSSRRCASTASLIGACNPRMSGLGRIERRRSLLHHPSLSLLPIKSTRKAEQLAEIGVAGHRCSLSAPPRPRATAHPDGSPSPECGTPWARAGRAGPRRWRPGGAPAGWGGTHGPGFYHSYLVCFLTSESHKKELSLQAWTPNGFSRKYLCQLSSLNSNVGRNVGYYFPATKTAGTSCAQPVALSDTARMRRISVSTCWGWEPPGSQHHT